MHVQYPTVPDVTIFGCGDLAGALACTLALRGWVGEIRLLDEAAPDVAAGKALDIRQALPIVGSDTQPTAWGALDRAAGADLLVLADRPGGEWSGEAALHLLKRVLAFAPRAAVVCAGATQRELIETAVRELHLDRRRIAGSAPGALEAAVRALVATELDVSPTEISLSVLGIPPAKALVAWSGASAHGQPIGELLAPPALARVNRRLPALWPPGPYALASAAAEVCQALASGSRRRHCCFVALDGELGPRGRAAALPVRIAEGRVDSVAIPPLSVQERVALENSWGQT